MRPNPDHQPPPRDPARRGPGGKADTGPLRRPSEAQHEPRPERPAREPRVAPPPYDPPVEPQPEPVKDLGPGQPPQRKSDTRRQ